jgi:hypothetical protein
MKDVFVKVTLNIVNLLVGLNGLVLIALSFVIIFFYIKDVYFTLAFLYAVTYGFLFLGIVLFALSLIGFMSILIKNYIMEGCYMFSLILVLIVLLTGAIATLVIDHNNLLEDNLYSNLNKTMSLFNESSLLLPDGASKTDDNLKESDEHNERLLLVITQTPKSTLTRDTTLKAIQIHRRFECCGVRSYLDWKNSTSLNPSRKFEFLNNDFLLRKGEIPFNLPDSCCVEFEVNCGKDFRSSASMFKRGCLAPLNVSLRRFMTFIYVTYGITFAIILFALFYFLFVSLAVKSEYNLIDQKIENSDKQTVLIDTTS